MPRRIVYDNTKLAVARILGDGTRQRTQVFSELQSHYLFDARFGRPGKGNDKGKVEGLVGYARRNFFVPIPRVGSWDALNADLERQCNARRGRRLRRHTETIGERFARDREALLPLPPVPYDACDTRTTRVTSLSLVRYRRNDYSVPTADVAGSATPGISTRCSSRSRVASSTCGALWMRPVTSSTSSCNRDEIGTPRCASFASC